mgnify:CR=1 FL=1
MYLMLKMTLFGGSFLFKQVPTEATHMKIRQLVCMFCVWAQQGQVTHYPVIPQEKKKIVLGVNYIINIFTFWGVSYVRSGFGQERKPATEAIVCRLLRAVAGSISM